MDEILYAMAKLGHFIGRNIDCGLDCDISQLRWAEYLLHLVFFVIVFVTTRRAINYFKKNDNQTHKY